MFTYSLELLRYPLAAPLGSHQEAHNASHLDQPNQHGKPQANRDGAV